MALPQIPSPSHPITDRTGRLTTPWYSYLLRLSAQGGSGGGPAPADADFVLTAADGGLPNARVLTDSPSITVDLGTVGQVSFDLAGGALPTPSATIEALDGTGDAGVSDEYSRGDHKHADANRPTNGEKTALAGTDGAPSALNPYVTDSDPRNTNARTPTAHATTHEDGGGDDVDLLLLAGYSGNADEVLCGDAVFRTPDQTGYWSPLTNGLVSSPEIVFDLGDTISIWTAL